MSSNNSQITDTVVMVRPSHFGFNPETGMDNLFQNETEDEINSRVKAKKEFEGMVTKLKKERIKVIVLESPEGPNGEFTPDAVFPNNWFTTHGTRLVIYPMKAKSRRNERQTVNLIMELGKKGIKYDKIVDLSSDESKGLFLEGTGSLVLDRNFKTAYALLSQRTIKEEFLKWSKLMDYKPVFFEATDKKGNPIYHTNVMLSVGEGFAVICGESIGDSTEKENVFNILKTSKHELMDISIDQMNNFCANILQIRNKNENLLVMSQRAKNSFSKAQITSLEKYGKIVSINIDEIEIVGGGGVRCMLAEIFYSKIHL